MIQARREGFALAATILAMLVVGAIVTGGFYAASQEGQVTRSMAGADDAMYIAETGLNYALGTEGMRSLDSIGINRSRTRSATNVVVSGQTIGNYVVTAYRMNELLYFVQSVGTQTRGGRYAGATRTVGSAVRVRTADFDTESAVVVFGDLDLRGTSDVNGTDTYDSSWTGQGCTTDPTTSAIVTNPETTITTDRRTTITGPITRETLDAGDFTVFGDLTWNEVASMAVSPYNNLSGTMGPQPYTISGRCDTSRADNWGSSSPSHVCFNHFPILYARGDLHISSSGYGQGILLVEGDLTISGGFTFNGVVVVLGTIIMTGTGGHVNGTTMAFGGGDFDSVSDLRGDSLLQYSSCSIERAVLNNSSLSRAIPIRHRAWIDLSAVRGGGN